ncbi:MAG: DUF126 domain-containing protein [Desulfurococcales archaeon]|nr:DUF126 domain-containing protein [Desulfurococcales archaeon]
MEFKGRAIVPGGAEGEAVVVDSISFYGEVDPDTGRLADGRSIKGRILIARRTRGSTVGSYIIYALAKNGAAPKAIIVERAEPIVIVGAILASIPLIDTLPPKFFETVRDGCSITVEGDTVRLLEECG